MSPYIRLAIIAIYIAMFSSTTLEAYEIAVSDDNERQQIATLVDKLKRGIQEQDVELIFDELCVDSTKYHRIKVELEQLASEAFEKDSTELFLSPLITYYREIEKEIEGFFNSLGNPSIKKPVSSFTDTWFIDVEQKDLLIFDNKQDASLDLFIGSIITPPDSFYLNQLSFEQRTSLSSEEREKLLHFSPVSLQLVKIRNKWRISNFHRLLELKSSHNTGRLSEKKID